jgi:hypothetical protein
MPAHFFVGTEHTAMPRIVAKPDNLNEFNSRFEQRPLTEPVFLNSVPKSGTHLIRNIMRMFVRVEQQYHQEFIQHPVLRQHQAAFSQAMPHLSWGHLLFSDDAAIVLRHVHHVLLVRDPYDWWTSRPPGYAAYSVTIDVGVPRSIAVGAGLAAPRGKVCQGSSQLI